MTLDGMLFGLLVAAAVGILSVFVLYPLAVLWAARGRGPRATEATSRSPAVSLLVALRNAEALAADKVANSLALVYPGPVQFVFVSDGSSDGTVRALRAAGGERIEVLELASHHGKAAALNLGAERCTGEILVLSDADAWLAPDALTVLVARFADPGVGGVCGQRVIREESGALLEAQGRYIAADSALKRAESRVGSVTSNDGKLYAVRRALFRPIAPGATDDLYTCLAVVEQEHRFVFEPRARAFIRTPSRGAAHELARRRRIVARSLRGIYLKRALLNPLRHGSFAFQLFVNKVLRRLLPVFLGLFFVASVGLAWRHPAARWLVALELAFLVLALLGGASGRRLPRPFSWCVSLAGTARYFCVGNLGTLLGLADFLRRKETVKWDPLKAD